MLLLYEVCHDKVVLLYTLSSANDDIEGFSSFLEFRNEDQQRVAYLGPAAPPARGKRGFVRVGSKDHGYPSVHNSPG